MNLRLSSKQIQTFAVLFCMIVMNISLSARADNSPLLIKDLGEGHCLVRVNTNQKYLLLPVEDASPDVRISMIINNKEVKNFDVRLAIHKVDYFVPVDLSDYSGKLISFKFKMNSNDPVRVNLSPDNTACCKEMKLSDTFDTSNREKFRPTYHFSPLYGWMNDPNGMVYKDGEYHLFYQYNPYGSKWGNMNWGHAISKDLVNWEHRPVAIAPDAFGTIFSGSAVIDHHNTAGFGAGAIVAIYTQNGDRQVQSIAYSTDNGRTFTKYENNPVLVSEARDFRDPKVFWYEGTKRWIMVLAVGQEMQFFSSPNLKDWTFESSFGKGHGAHGNVWECPDLFELPVEGTNEKIDTSEISNNLNSNIDKENVRTSSNSKAIDEFVEHICQSYKDTIISTSYENTINEKYSKITQKITKVQNILIIAIIISIIGVIALNVKDILKLLFWTESAVLSSAVMQLAITTVIKSKVNIDGIKIFNDAFSNIVVTIIKDILSKINIIAGKFIIVYFILVVIYAIIILTQKKEENQNN